MFLCLKVILIFENIGNYCIKIKFVVICLYLKMNVSLYLLFLGYSIELVIN